MKKILSILIIIMLFSLLVTGCSDNSDQPIQNEEEAAGDDANEEMEEEPEEETGNDLDDNEEPNEGFNEIEMKLFEDVYLESGLIASIEYVHENYDSFSEESLSNYLDSLEKTITEKADYYGELLYFEVYPSQIPNTIEYIGDIYKDIYYPEENQFNVNLIAQDNIDEALALNDDEFFTFTKAYYAMDGSIEDIGFRMVIKKEVYAMLADLYPGESFSEERKETALNVSTYTDHFTSMDKEFESEYTYPIVLVDTCDKIEELRNAWKTEVLIPVEIVNIPVENENDSTADDESSSDDPEEDLSQGFIIEEYKSIPEEVTEYFEYLNPLYEDVDEDKLTTYYFEIDGAYNSIGLESVQNLDDLPEAFAVDSDGSNMFLVYKTFFPSDFSSDTIIITSENGNEYKLQLNDAVDRDLYKYVE
jgi:ABC-type antimicrobial peptide transport system permease subunit